MLASPFGAAVADEAQIKIINPGHNITLWSGWNVTGSIFIKIDGGDGSDCLRLWWIRMGINSDSWEVCDRAEVTFVLPLVYGELRAGHAQRQMAIAVSEDSSVAYSPELCGRVIEC